MTIRYPFPMTAESGDMSLGRQKFRFPPILFAIKNLFKNGETGFWYDPSDLSVLFQKSDGTIPVTGVEQPVGLMLDKSLGATLGSELITNGTFDSDADWTLGTGWSISGGAASSDGSQLTDSTLDQGNLTTNEGKLYKISFEIVSSASGDIDIRFDGVKIVANATSVGVHTGYYKTANTTTQFSIAASLDFVGSIDNVSIKEVSGCHATQATSAARPTLSARYNLLEQTENFADGYWIKGNSTISSDVATSNNGTMTADKLIATAASSSHYIRSSGFTSIIGKKYTYSVEAKESDAGYHLELLSTAIGAPYVGFVADLSDGTILDSDNGTVSVDELSNGWRRYNITFTATASSSIFDIRVTTASTRDTPYTGDGTSGIYIWGADLRESQYDALPYQRVGDATTTPSDYDSTPSKFPYRIRFDGVDDYMVVNGLSSDVTPLTAHFGYVTDDGESSLSEQKLLSLRDTSTNQLQAVTVSGGIRGIGYYDGIVHEADYDSEALTVATYDVSSGDGNISVNGSYVLTAEPYTECLLNSGAKLCCNYLGTGHFLNGDLYQAVLRTATSTAKEIEDTEKFINKKMTGDLLP